MPKAKTYKLTKRAASSTLKQPAAWLYEALAGATSTTAGVTVGPETALNLSAVWACVRVISETIGSLPWFTYRRTTDGGRDRATEHEVYTLLHDSPNPLMTAMVWKEVSVAHALTWGNAYSEIVRDENMRIAALFPIHPCRVTPKQSPLGHVYYEIGTNGGPVTLDADDMLHVPGLGGDGLVGYSVVQKARESLGLTAASEKFGASFFGNGSRAGGILKHPKTLSDKGRENLKKSVESDHRGADKAFRLMLLEEGIDFTQTTVPPEDAQFLETRQFQVEEVCRWFRVPPHKIQHLLRSTFSNIEHQSIEFVTDTIRPWLVRFEQEANRKLIRPSQRATYYTENLVDALLRGDAMSRSQALKIQADSGALLLDEWRAVENRNPLPDGLGKRPLVTQQAVPLDRIDEQIDAKIAPQTPPGANGDDSAADVVARHLAVVAAERGEHAAAAESRRIARLIEANLEG